MRLPGFLPRSSATALAVLLAVTVTGCGSGSGTDTAASSGASGSDAVSGKRTAEFDAIGVIGHSGATGANAEGDGSDVRENSWATGDNPDVKSIYLRLLADHPALKGHNFNTAKDGSDASALMDQAELLLAMDPVPDLVLINSIDNDIQCDGSDESNYDTFEGRIDDVLTFLQKRAAGIRVFFVDQWTSVVKYDDVVSPLPGGIAHNMDSGPCGVFTTDGTRNPEAEIYLQQQVDTYMDRIIAACGRHDDCATDNKAMQGMPLEAADLATDFDHLSAIGLAKEAAIAWDALPADWK
jgi:hypothetical protein